MEIHPSAQENISQQVEERHKNNNMGHYAQI